MFGSFTERAQRVLYLSQEEARKLGHSLSGLSMSSWRLPTRARAWPRALHNMGLSRKRFDMRLKA